MSLVGLGFFNLIMDFFNQLLSSYALLKKRKFRVRLEEADAREKNYSDLVRAAKAGDSVAAGVISQVDGQVGQGYEDFDPLEHGGVEDSSTSCITIQSPMGGDPLEFCPGAGGRKKKVWERYRNELAQTMYPTELNTRYEDGSAEDGIGATVPASDPITQELMQHQKFVDILTLKSDTPGEEHLGPELAAAITDLYRVAGENGLGAMVMQSPPEEPEYESIEGLEGEDLKRAETRNKIKEKEYNKAKNSYVQDKSSLFYKIWASVKGEEVKTRTEEEAIHGDEDGVAYIRPKLEDILGAVENLRETVELANKLNPDSGEDFTEMDFENLQRNVTGVKFKVGSAQKFRVFIRYDDLEDLGLCFDWDLRRRTKDGQSSGFSDNRTAFQTFFKETQDALDVWGADREESAKLKLEDRDNFQEGTAATTKVITEVSEELDTVVTLITIGGMRSWAAATEMLSDLWEKFGNNLLTALKINRELSQGHLVGTAQSLGVVEELLDVMHMIIDRDEEIEEIMASNDNPDKVTMHRLFDLYMQKLVRWRKRDMDRMKPDFVARVGSSVAGIGGAKVDQRLFYNTKESADSAAERGGVTSPINSGVLREILDEDELALAVQRFGVDPDQEVHYINDSLKWTNDSARTNIGSTGSVVGMSQAFQGGPNVRQEDRDYHEGLLDTLLPPTDTRGMSPDKAAEAQEQDVASRDQVRANFKTMQGDIDTLDSLFNLQDSSPNMTATQTLNMLGNSFSESTLKKLGISPQAMESFKDTLREKQNEDPSQETPLDSSFMSAMRGKIEYAMVMGRIQQGSTKLNNKGERVPKGGAKARAWRQVAALYTMRGCYDTSDSEMVIQNYKNGDSYRYHGNPYLMKALNSYVDHEDEEGNSHKIPNPEEGSTNDSIEYTPTELMNKLLEVQQLMFSQLIKE